MMGDMVAPVITPTGGSSPTPAVEEPISFCGCCRTPVHSDDLLTTINLPRNVTCFGCGEQHISKMGLCAECLTLAIEEDLKALAEIAGADTRPERRRLARFIISACKTDRMVR